MAEPFIAEVRMFGCDFAPRGWAECLGQLMPISQNSALFSLVGTTYGGDGRTTFGVPDFRARTPMHSGDGPGLTPRQLGEKSGLDAITLNSAQIPQHNHTLRGAFAPGTTNAPSSTRAVAFESPAEDDNIFYIADKDTGSLDRTMAATAFGQTGGSQAHENRQPFIGVTFCIALTGIYPSRS